MDTSKDIRIQFMEKVIATLQHQVKKGVYGSTKKHPQLAEKLKAMASAVMTMKYAYLDDTGLRDMGEHQILVEGGAEVLETLANLGAKDPQKRAYLRFYRLTLGQFRESFSLAASLESCVPTELGVVASKSKHRQAKNLIVTHVDVFGENLQIVTNLVDTKQNQRMKVALVYPAPVMGVLSEAQFVGAVGAGDEALVLTDDERQEVRRSMGNFLEQGL